MIPFIFLSLFMICTHSVTCFMFRMCFRPVTLTLAFMLFAPDVMAHDIERKLLTIHEHHAPKSVMAMFGYVQNEDYAYVYSHRPPQTVTLKQHKNIYVDLADPRPVIKIRVGQNTSAYRQYVLDLVRSVVRQDRHAGFEVVAVYPSRTTPMNVSFYSRRAKRHAENAANIILRDDVMNIDSRKVRLSTSPDLEVTGSEVHIYIESTRHLILNEPNFGYRTDDGLSDDGMM